MLRLTSGCKVQGLPRLFLNLLLFGSMTVASKLLVSRSLSIQDDDHVFDILRSKFSNFSTFHTSLYTCSAEFDFIGMEVSSRSRIPTFLDCRRADQDVPDGVRPRLVLAGGPSAGQAPPPATG